MSSGGDPSETGEGGSEDIGHARTEAPRPGQAVAAAATPVKVDTISSKLGERPESDRLQRALARNRVAEKLFAKKQAEVKLGRYHLLQMLGAGGMGVVWGAWDPELDRKVAIKLVKTEMQAARDRILIEGQALAKLSHPNIVPVFDVGVVDEQVYLVMEWVRGKNLRAWCREPRTVREIVGVYRAAGEGLSAAHRAGLIHRDFKPDNAMIGDDGRVRVLDFGLARGEVKADSRDKDSLDRYSSDLTRGAGTPRYMPVEQAEGRELSPAVDQYALAVSLREALVGRTADGKDADVPRWLDVIIDRATAREAANRFESMDALVHALSRDPATIWRRRGIALGAVAFAGGMFAVGTLRAGGADECGGATEEIAKTFDDTAGSKLAAHLTTLGPYGAEEAKRLIPDLLAYGQRWAATHTRVCKANKRKELSPQLYDVRLACLSRAQVALQTITAILGRANKERLPDAIVATRALPEVELCASETSSSTIKPPATAIKAEVDQVSKDVSAIRYLGLALDPTTKSLAAQSAARADQLGYEPLIARAHLALGFGILGDGNNAREAVPELAHARSSALKAGDTATFIEAYAREVFALTRDNRVKLIDVEATHALVEDLSMGTPDSFVRTLLLNNLGIDRLAAGDIAGSRGYFERAVKESGGKRDIELHSILGNLAMVTDDPNRRSQLFREEHELQERELGANHPVTIGELMRSAAQRIDNPVAAAEAFRDVCTRLTMWHAELQRKIDACYWELGWLAAERGDLVEMSTAMSAVKQPDNRLLKVASAYLLLAEGKAEEAARSMDAYGETMAKDPEWAARMVGANALLVAAMAHEKLGQLSPAIDALKRALGVFDDPQINKSASYIQRRIARTRAMLAKLVAKSEPETAKSLAREALRWYRQAGGYDAVIRELEAI
jgi:serine/threonine protein kinase